MQSQAIIGWYKSNMEIYHSPMSSLNHLVYRCCLTVVMYIIIPGLSFVVELVALRVEWVYISALFELTCWHSMFSSWLNKIPYHIFYCCWVYFYAVIVGEIVLGKDGRLFWQSWHADFLLCPGLCSYYFLLSFDASFSNQVWCVRIYRFSLQINARLQESQFGIKNWLFRFTK